MRNRLILQERQDIDPICPHCGQELDSVCLRHLESSILSRRSIYFCPHCRKVLGVSHRKGLLAN
jgi:hypothetical protein